MADDDATLDLAVGENAVSIEVTAEDGETKKTYTVSVTRAAPALSGDATLSGLALSGIDFGAFDPAVTAYTADVANDVTETTVTPATNHDGATYVVKLDGVADADGTVALAVGGNAVTIEVTAEDGQTAKTYTVTVTRAAPALSGDATLSGLALSGITLAFDPAITAYTADVANDVTETTVTPATNHDGATYMVKLDGVADADGTVALAVGGNAVTIEVTAEDGQTAKTYTVTVTRAAPALSGDATLSGLALSGITLAFDPAITAYTADVANDVTETTVTPTVNHDGATYVVKLDGVADADGTVALAVGGNAVTIEVTAEDGQTAKTYAVTVTRAAPELSGDATLSGLALSGIDFGAFDPAVTGYAAEVANDVTETTVTPTVNHDGATYVVKLDGVADADATLDLAVGGNAVTIEVTAEDGKTAKTYTVTVTRADAPPDDTPAGPAAFVGIGLPSEMAEGEASKVNLAFFGLEPDSDRATRDYVFRADVKNSENEDASVCEGKGMGRDRPIWMVDQDPESRAVVISADCPAGDYTLRVSIRRPNYVRVASDRVGFTIEAPAQVSGPDRVRAAEESTGTAGSSITVVIETIATGKRVAVSWTDGGTCATTSSYNAYMYLAPADSTLAAGITATPVADTSSYSVSKDFTSFGVDEVSIWCGTPASGRLVAKVAGLNEGAAGTYTHSVPGVATLGTLSLSHGTLRPDFAADTTEYRAAVANGVAQVTVLPAATDSRATVSYLDGSGAALADADDNTAGHQVAAAVGLTTFKVKVTAADGNTVETYTVVVERDSAAGYGWTPTRDLNGLNAAGNGSPWGLWSDGTTVWVADASDDKLYAYTLATGARDSAEEFDLHAENDNPTGIWSNGTTVWVADASDDKLYAYTLSGGARDSDKEFNLHTDNGRPTGIWSDRTTVWVADGSDAKLYAYTLSGGARHSDNDIALDSANDNPTGVWSDGTTIWVSDLPDDDLYAYALSGGARQAGRDFTTLAGTGGFGGSLRGPAGIWSDGTTMWALGTNTLSGGGKIYSFNMPPPVSTDATLSGLALSDGALRPDFAADTTEYRAAVANDVSQVTVTPTVNDAGATVTYLDGSDAVLADADDNTGGHQVAAAVGPTTFKVKVTAADTVTVETYTVVVERDSAADFGWTPTRDLNGLNAAGNTAGYSIWSDGTTVWVADLVDDKLYAYTLANGARDSGNDITLHTDNGSTRGIWSNGTTIWVADQTDDKLYAYALSDGTRDMDKEFALDATNGKATGVWSNGTTIWVADQTDSKLYAYALSDGTRATAKEFTLDATNGKATGVWSNGTTMWVADSIGDKLYAYALSDGTRQAGKEFGTLAGTGGFDGLTVGPAGIWSDGTTMWAVRIDLVDTDSSKIYSFNMPPSADATLLGLILSPGTLRPGFDSDETEYRAAVANGVAQVTVISPANDFDATVTYLDGSDAALADADTGADWHQVDAAVGLTTFKVKVTAADTVTTQTYTVVVERDSAADYGWTPTRDFNGLTAAGNRNGYGIWTDGTTIWVADNDDDKLYAYTLDNGARDSDKDIELDSANANPTGVWSNGTTIWVADNEDNKLYAYALSGGTRATAKEFNLHSANDNPQSVWSDETTIWVSDFGDGKLYAYALSDGTRATAKEFALHASHPIPLGIWSDGTTIWVGNLADDGLYAYALDGGARQAGKDFNTLAGTGGFADTAKGPTGIASDGTTMWALGTDTISVGSKIYSFNMPPPAASADATLSNLALSDGALRPGFADDETEYRAAVANGVAQVTVTPTANDAGATVTYLDDSDAALADADTGAPGHQVDAAVGLTTFKVKVTAADGNTVETYTVVIERDSAADYGWTPTRDFNGLNAAGNENGRGIWIDGTTMWVTDWEDDKLYAYNQSTGARDSDKDITLHADNDDPYGIWSNGTTMWVADNDDKLYAYTLSGGTRDSDKEFNLHADNASPTGIWSDGTTVWVADIIREQVYAYTLSDGTRNTAKEFTSAVANDRLLGITSDGTTIWAADLNDDKLYAYALSGGARQAGRDFNTLTGTGGFAGTAGTRGIWSDGSTMWVVASDSSPASSKVYSFNMPPPSEADATLSALTVSPGTFTAPFRPAQISYSAFVGHAVTSVAVTATTNNANAAAVIRKGGTAYADGMVPLELGHNVITITVTPQDATAPTKTYRLTVVRQSNDATLGSVTVSPGPNVELDPVQYPYFAAVENTVSRVTVNATANHPDAYLFVARQIAGPYVLFPAAGLNLDLNVGVPTTFIIRVHAQDSSVNLEFYQFVIARESVDPFGWKALADISDLDQKNTNAEGIWSDGTTLWVMDSLDGNLYAYNLDTGARESGNDFDEVGDLRFIPLGVWGNEDTIWIVDDGNGLRAHYRATKARDTTREFELDFDNDEPRGIWSDGATMWVSDSVDSKLYAYALDGGARQPGRDFNTLNAAGNGSPWGLWSDGATMWVADDEDDRVYAYDMATGAYVAARDFTTLGAAGNGDVRGIWSDGEVMWAVQNSDYDHDKIFSYNLPPSDNAGLKALAMSGLTLDPAFAAGTVSYAATATAGSATVTATPRQRFTRSVVITPADAGPGTGGHQVDLPDDALTVIRVRVTAQDGSSKTYTVRVTRGTPPVPADDATLVHLSLSNPADGGAITLTPPFGSGETGYTAQVDDGVSEADVSATARHPSATVAVTGGAGNVLAGPVPLDEGKNVINVTVTSADGSASKTYTVTVYRAKAPPQIIKGPYIRRAPANGQTFAGPYVIQGPDGTGGLIREQIEVLVTFSEKFLVWPDSDRSASEIGTAHAPFPYVELDIGGVKRRAHYWARLPTGHRWGDNPENTAIFTYEVQPGDLDRNGVTIAAGEVFLPDPAETDRPDAERPVIMAGGRWGDPYDLRHEGMAESWPVNLAAPRVTGVAFIGDGGRDNAYGEGSGVDFEVTFDEIVVVNTARGQPRLRLELERSDAPRYATYDGGSGSRTLKFFYRVQGNDWDGDGVDIAQNGLEPDGGRIHSEHHSAVLARLGHAGVEGGGTRLVDGIPPSIIAVTIEADPNGAFTDIHVDFDEIMRVGIHASDKARIETDQGDAVYHSISDRVIGGVRVSRLTFRYQGTGSVVIPSGAEITGYTGSIEDLAGNEPRSLLVDGGG